MSYIDPISIRIRDLLENGMGDAIKEFVYGEPTRAPSKGDLPLIAIINTTERLSRTGTRRTMAEFQMTLKVMTDFTGEIDDWDIKGSYMKLKELIGARNDDYGLEDQTVLGILDANKRLDPDKNLYIRNDIEAVYNNPFNPLEQGGYAVSANVTFGLYLEATSGDA